jgi:cyclopropane fatty-acyl-phospholipid synthase-like methyltransferase
LKDESIDNLGDFQIVVSFTVFMHLPVVTFINYLQSVYGMLDSGGYFAFQIAGSEHFTKDVKHYKENRFDVMDDEKRFETRWYPEYLIASYLTSIGFYVVGVPKDGDEIWKCRKF